MILDTHMLTDAAIRRLTPRDKPYKVADGGGLHVYVSTTGSRLWRMAYRWQGRHKLLSFGPYPATSLADARRRREAAKEALAAGRDPAAPLAATATFGAVSREWLEKRRVEGLAPATDAKMVWVLGMLSALDAVPVAGVTPAALLVELRKIEARGCRDSARRARSVAGRVLRYAVATGRAERDSAADLRDALTAPVVRHRAALFEPVEVGGLLRAIRSYREGAARAALLFTLFTLARPGEVRGAEWGEFAGPIWRIPAARTKMRRDLVLPLSTQAQAVLVERAHLARPFPSLRPGGKPISENTTNAALRVMGYGTEDVTSHGFRRTGSTLLNEMGWNRDWIEAQLGHITAGVRGTYNAAVYLSDRTRMMQAWGDYLESLDESS